MLKVYLYGDEKYPIVKQSIELIELRDDTIIVNKLEKADLAIAPYLKKILPFEEINKPRLGTLIFHPSLLPLYRGKNAIKDAFKNGEKTSGATWFWADEGIDTGDICEQRPIVIDNEMIPKRFYINKVIPVAIKMLLVILDDLEYGYVRRRVQNELYTSYNS